MGRGRRRGGGTLSGTAREDDAREDAAQENGHLPQRALRASATPFAEREGSQGREGYEAHLRAGS